MTHPFHESTTILSDFVRAASDPIARSPSARRLRWAIEYLTTRCDKPALRDALKDLDETPPRITFRVREVARELLNAAESAPHLSKDEQEQEAKKAHLKSSQYAHERLINWAFTLFSAALLVLIARHIHLHGLTTDQLKTMIFFGFIPLFGAFKLISRPNKPFTVFDRFFAYRALTGHHDLSFNEWISGRVHGMNARPTRRQAFILFVALYLAIVFVKLRAPGPI